MTSTTNAIERDVLAALETIPGVRSARVIGSRARGDAGPLSDWDFEVETDDFESTAPAIERGMEALHPLAAQWDRLSPHMCYMLMLAGAVKIDLLFLDQPHELEPPWVVTAETLPGLDAHFWDWTLWLAAKQLAGKRELVADELEKMSLHILAPMGVDTVPERVEQVVVLYTEARALLESELDTVVPGALETGVRAAMRANGFSV